MIRALLHRKKVKQVVAAFDRFGPQLTNWPQQWRDRYSSVAKEPEIAAAEAEAQKLEAALASLPMPELPATVRAGVLSTIASERMNDTRTRRHISWPASGNAVRFAAMAVALVLGAAVGIIREPMAPPEQVFFAYAKEGSIVPGLSL